VGLSRHAVAGVTGLLAIAACSSGKPHVVEDAKSVQPPARDAAVVAPTGPYRAVSSEFAKGDVQIRVEWHDVPTVARANEGRTACGTPRAPTVAPTTTWGIPEAIVMIDVDHGKPLAEPDAPESRVVLASCALTPRVVIAGKTLHVASTASEPARLALTRMSSARPLGAAGAPDASARAIQLPIAGHEVAVTLEPDSSYVLAGDPKDADAATILVPPTPYYAVTEANGQVVVRDVPVGSYPVVALLPARSGQPARMQRGMVTVVAGGLAETTVDLTNTQAP
jgi:hypothetical protein